MTIKVLQDSATARAFFKILAQESVKKAKKDILKEADDLDKLLGDMDSDDAASGNKQQASNKSTPKSPPQTTQNAPAPSSGDSTSQSQPGPSADETAKDYGQNAMKQKLNTVDDLQQKDVSLDSIIDKLNTLRAGKSFKDEAVAKQVEVYYNSMSSNERMALYSFLKGLAQLSVGEIDGSAASRPDTDPPGISMTRSDQGEDQTSAGETEQNTEEPAQQKTQSNPGEQEAPTEEENDEAPIKVGATSKAKVEGFRSRIKRLLTENT